MSQVRRETNYRARRGKAFLKMKQAGIEALCVISAVNLRYLTGFVCSFGRLVLIGGRVYLFTDGRYTNDARRSLPGIEIVETDGARMNKDIAALLRTHDARALHFEKDHITHAEFLTMKKAMRGIGLEPLSGVVEDLRLYKDADEIEAVRRACRIGDLAFKHICGVLRPGMTERAAAASLNAFMMSRQVDGLAFDSIVAAGPRGAFAHAHPSHEKIKKGDLVVLDFGVCLDGYHSDMTRTAAIGQPSSDLRRMYEAVRAAQSAALDGVRAGASVRTLDQAARRVLRAQGLERYFNHGLGHGVGLEIHEAPRLSSVSDDRLRRGSVVTIEPGVYIDGLGGVRIEDTVAITPQGVSVLTRSTKKLVIL